MIGTVLPVRERESRLDSMVSQFSGGLSKVGNSRARSICTDQNALLMLRRKSVRSPVVFFLEFPPLPLDFIVCQMSLLSNVYDVEFVNTEFSQIISLSFS